MEAIIKLNEMVYGNTVSVISGYVCTATCFTFATCSATSARDGLHSAFLDLEEKIIDTHGYASVTAPEF
jgi:hypothetical protein